jgi:hypothetical protein
VAGVLWASRPARAAGCRSAAALRRTARRAPDRRRCRRPLGAGWACCACGPQFLSPERRLSRRAVTLTRRAAAPPGAGGRRRLPAGGPERQRRDRQAGCVALRSVPVSCDSRRAAAAPPRAWPQLTRPPLPASGGDGGELGFFPASTTIAKGESVTWCAPGSGLSAASDSAPARGCRHPRPGAAAGARATRRLPASALFASQP